MPATTHSAPWYRQFWAWFVIVPPLVAVVAGTATVIIATQHADSLVVGDFQRVGLRYQNAGAALEAAQRRGIGASVALPDASGTLSVRLDGAHGEPAQLRLTLAHATRGQQDQRLTLVRVDGDRYQGRLPAPLGADHYLVLEPPDGAWRLQQRLPQGATQARLGAAESR